MTEHDPTTLRHLLLTFPELEVRHDGRDVVDELVKGAIHAIQAERGRSSILLLTEVVARIRTLADLTYEPAEIHAALQRLQTSDFLRFTSPGNDSFIADSQGSRDVASTLAERTARDERVHVRWSEHLASAYTIDEEEVLILSERFNTFLADVVHFHAAEAAAFLYIGDDEGQARFFERLDSRLPAATVDLDDRLVRVAETAFRDFFRNPDPDFRDYVADRLQVAFYYHLLSIDPAGSEFVRDNLADKVLYLDTNFIYRLLGLHGPAYAYSPAAVADISRQLGFTLRVTRETVNEYLRSLRAEVHRLRSYPVTRESYVQVLAENPGDHLSFMQAFYKLFMSGRVKGPDEFEHRYTSITQLLDEWGVEIEDVELTDAERDTDVFRDRFSDLNNWHNQQKPIESIDHDVFLAQTVRRCRGPVDESASAVKYWLLTYDRKLAKYSVYHATSDQLPFCLMADDWLQITRPFLPRTDDYQNAFCALLDNPALYPSEPAVPFEHMAEAMHRLERYRELPMPVVASMVAGGEFVRKLRAASSRVQEAQVIELAAAEAAQLAIEENETLKTAVSELTDRFAGLEERLHASVTQLGRVSEERDEAERQAGNLRAALTTQEAALTTQGERDREERARLEAEFQNSIRRREEEQKEAIARLGRLGRWVLYGLASLVVSVETIRLASGVWPDSSAIQQVVLVGSLGLVLAGLLAIPLGGRGWKIFLGVTALVGVCGLAYQLWTS